ncbi:inner membrane protein YdgC [Clostridium ragsdalei P11]|uniref:Inner membrane protein YdgC n=1 Tax=Clostridium ragsdalei P11 TaxID=1353534 RepID=A0A1A6AM82_9CLOT|nr:GlpM family protein [Clostridium ragsdalei]OBR91133.1 inner membrane protein YdgC [Clostridium ragsdalei P11]
MNVGLIIKPLVGALVVIVIQVLSKSKNYYIAALVPLFPLFGIMAYYIVGLERGTSVLENTIIFGMFSLIPYFVFLITLYFSIKHYKLGYSLIIGSIAWVVIAVILVVLWNRFKIGQ